MLTKKDLETQRELMQSEVFDILDGAEDDDRLLFLIDQVIVDRIQILIDKLSQGRD